MVSLKEETADCLLRAVCEANEDSSLAGEVAREAVEVGSFLLLSVLPLESSLITDMVMAARVGRVNYGTSRLGERDSSAEIILFPGPGLCQRVYNGCQTYH